MLKLDVPHDLTLSENQGELFFAQRVTELTYMYTGESYRVSTTTVPFLTRECLSVIDDHRKFELHISSVERILAELERRTQGNILVKSLARMPLEAYFKYDPANLADLENRIRVLSKEVSPLFYLKEASSALLACSPQEKDKIDFLASEFVCTLVNLGVSSEYIYQEAERIFFKDAKNEGKSRISDFLDFMQPFQSEFPKFSALVPLKTGIGDINDDILKLFKSAIVNEIPAEFLPLDDFAAQIDGKQLLHITDIRSFDPQTAAKSAKRTVVRIHDLLGLFYHKGSNEIGPCILVAKNGQPQTSVMVKSNQNLMQMISDNRRDLATRKLETMIKTLRLPIGEDSEKFFRVVDFHGMSLNSSIPENQLINLWTSLETISPSLKGKSIIGSVCEAAIPIIGLQYIHRTFLTAVKDIKRWDNNKFKGALKEIHEGKDLAEKTFLLICDPQKEQLCTSLLAEMDDFPLLKHRIFSLNRRFNSGKKALREINLHTTKAEQQIHRIYRARNSIVHSAQKSQLTENLIISAHEYFDQIFSAAVELCSKPFMFDSYRDAFNYSRMAFKSYCGILDELGDAPVIDPGKFVWRAR